MPATATKRAKRRSPPAESQNGHAGETIGPVHETNGHANGKATAAPAEFELLAIDVLEPHPENPRKEFDPVKLAELAESLKRHGMLQPLVVRPHYVEGFPSGKRYVKDYQVICGERRYRAARMAQLERVPCIVRQLSDRDALEVMIVENEERENLNAIELALGLSALCKPVDAGGCGLTQKEAATRFGHEEAWANNLIRLLALPPAWRQKIASGELPQTFGRALLPYAKSQEVLKRLEKDLKRDDLATMDREAFERTCYWAVREDTRPVEEFDKPYHDFSVTGNYGNFGRLFDLTPEIEAQLGITKLPKIEYQGAKQVRKMARRATNVKLWDKLQEDAKKKLREKRATKKSGTKKSAEKGRKPTAAELKRKREHADDILRRRIELWAEDLLRAAAIRALTSRSNSVQGQWVTRWLVQWWLLTRDGQMRGREAWQEAFTKLGGRGCEYDDDRWEAAVTWVCADEDAISQIDALYLGMAAVVLNPDGNSRCSIDRDVVWSLARLLGIRLSEEWTTAKGDRLRDFFDAHTSEQLQELTGELSQAWGGGKKKDQVELLAGSHESKPLRMPKVLKDAAPVVRRKAK